MSFSKLIAGVDRSESGAWAGVTAWEWAGRAGAECSLLYAVSDELMAENLVPEYSSLLDDYLAGSRAALIRYLEGNVPPEALETVEAVFGRPAAALCREAKRRMADLLVLGAKHHSAVGRLLVGSTVHNAVRVATVPILIATPGQDAITRVLCAVDLSESAESVTRVAIELAALHQAELKVTHVVDETIAPAGLPAATSLTELREHAHRALSDRIWPMVDAAGGERSLRGGHPLELVRDELDQFEADLLVLGTHGKGWFDRAVLGSVAHGLISEPPVSLVVVPPRLAQHENQRSESDSDRWSRRAV